MLFGLILDSQEEEDGFRENVVPMPLNLSPSKYRTAVQRNESYCYAIGGPQKRPVRSSPLISKGLETIQDRPSSTVAVPTPPSLTTTIDGPTKTRNPTPIPPPRGDSFNKSTIANYQIQRHMATTNGTKFVVAANVPHPPSPTRQKANDESSIRRSYNRLPSYEQTIQRLRSRSSTSDSQDREDLQDSQDIVFASADIASDSPFEREGFGRQSMSEKKARSSVDAKKTQMYLIREKQKELIKNKNRPSSDHEIVNGSTPLLRKAKSEGQMQSNAIIGMYSYSQYIAIVIMK